MPKSIALLVQTCNIHKVLTLCFSIFFLAEQLLSYELAPIWTTSPYMKADSYNIINNVLTGNSSTPTATMTFSSAFSGIPNLAYGITRYEGNDYMMQQNFQVNKTALTSSSFSVRVKILGITNLWFLCIRYIAVDNAFPHNLNSYDNVPVNYSSGPITNISAMSLTRQYYVNTINFTAQSTALGFNYVNFSAPLNNNKVILFMTTLYHRGSSQSSPTFYPLDLQIVPTILSSETYMLNVSYGINACFDKLHFSMIIYDYADILASKLYEVVDFKMDFSTAGGFIQIPPQFQTNLIMGLVQYSSLLTRVTICFNIDFGNDANGIFGLQMNVSNPVTLSSFSRFGFNVFYIKTWVCPIDTFYNSNISLCASCPILACLTCFNLTFCQVCDEDNNFYQKINEQIPKSNICSYDISRYVAYLAYGVMGFSLAVFLLGTFIGRLVSVQMMAVLQISYLGMATFRGLNPSFKVLSLLWPVNGINYFLLPEVEKPSSSLSSHLAIIPLFSQFLHNFNLTQILPLLPFLIGFVLFVASRLSFKISNKTRLLILAKRSCCQFVFNFLMFCGYVIGVGFVLEVSYGIMEKQSQNSHSNKWMWIWGGSISSSIFYVVLFAVYFVMLIKIPFYFGQYVYYFKAKNNILSKQDLQHKKDEKKNRLQQGSSIDRKFYLLLIFERFVNSILLITVSYPLIPIGIFAILFLIVLIRQPYCKWYHNVRFCCNMAICIAIMGIFMGYRSKKEDINVFENLHWHYMPILVLVLLLICIIYSLVAIVYDFIKHRNEMEEEQNKQAKQFANEQDELVKQVNREYMMSNINQTAKNLKSEALEEGMENAINKGQQDSADLINIKKIDHSKNNFFNSNKKEDDKQQNSLNKEDEFSRQLKQKMLSPTDSQKQKKKKSLNLNNLGVQVQSNLPYRQPKEKSSQNNNNDNRAIQDKLAQLRQIKRKIRDDFGYLDR